MAVSGAMAVMTGPVGIGIVALGVGATKARGSYLKHQAENAAYDAQFGEEPEPGAEPAPDALPDEPPAVTVVGRRL